MVLITNPAVAALMQRSAIGNKRIKKHLFSSLMGGERQARSGFTLFEVMIVMAIIAIITSVAFLSIHLFNRSRQIRLSIHQLMQTLKFAQQEALLKPAVLGLRFSHHSYRFYQFENVAQFQGKWKLLKQRPFVPNQFDGNLRVIN